MRERTFFRRSVFGDYFKNQLYLILEDLRIEYLFDESILTFEELKILPFKFFVDHDLVETDDISLATHGGNESFDDINDGIRLFLILRNHLRDFSGEK